MADSDQVKAALAALAKGEGDRDRQSAECDLNAADRETAEQSVADGYSGDYRAIIEQASAATSDLDEAARFVETVGIEPLERAVEQAEYEVSGLTEVGREALEAFREYQAAAAAEKQHR